MFVLRTIAGFVVMSSPFALGVAWYMYARTRNETRYQSQSRVSFASLLMVSAGLVPIPILMMMAATRARSPRGLMDHVVLGAAWLALLGGVTSLAGRRRVAACAAYAGVGIFLMWSFGSD